MIQPVSAPNATLRVEIVLRTLLTARAGRLWALAALLSALLTSFGPRAPARAQSPPLHTITWDSHSLIVDGHRVLLYSGEFHYWRLPSPTLWEDRLEKMKAAGLNAVSIYFDWQYHSSSPGQYDFTGVRDVDRLLRLTDRLGLYVIARVGPYMNGEADAGGLPGWLLSKPLYPRSQSWHDGGGPAQPVDTPLYLQYSREWFDHILPIVARHQVTAGGSVALVQVENEYSQDQGSQQYMQDLYDYGRADGITVPIFHNDFWFKGDWSHLVDLYAYDSYPYGFSCCHQWWDTHFHGIDTWESVLRTQLKITTPMFVSELQGGSFDGWGGSGYAKVAWTLDGDWLDAIDQSALAQGTSVLNTYMFAGGTSWGYMSAPDVYTSYDYGAPISESGTLRPSYYAAHRLGMFLNTWGEHLAGADAATAATTSNSKIVVHSRVDAASGQTFIFLRHGDPGAPATTHLQLTLQGRQLVVPQQPGTAITVPGHGVELLVANIQTGPLHLDYSTSSVLTDAATANGHYLVLYGPEGSSGEAQFSLPTGGVTVTHNANVHVTQSGNELRVDYRHTSEPRIVKLQTPTGTLRLVITTDEAASRYWLQDDLLVAGPDLVTADGPAQRLWSARSRAVRVYGAPPDRSLLIDGQLTALPDDFTGATLLGSNSGPQNVRLPALDTWRFQEEAPETQPGFDDSSWQLADHTGTTNPNVPATTTTLADDYGFHYGFVWYRGHFTGSPGDQGIALQARHSYSVYLNGRYIGGGDAPLDDPPHSYGDTKFLGFPPDLVHQGADNVVAVLTESLGHDEGWVAGPAAQSPQGLLAASIGDGTTPISWRIQGAAGGDQPADAERGLLNASGLYGERSGWHLPGFNDAAWSTVHLPDNWARRGVGTPIGWYRTHFTLAFPAASSIPLAVTIPHAADKAVIWLNGWLVGRYWEQRGPQHTFYLPEGILNTHGDNVLAVAVWNRGHAGGLASLPALHRYRGLAPHSLLLASPNAGPSPGYWHTAGNRVVDDRGRPVRIAAASWFGMENVDFVPAGLDKQPLSAILAAVRGAGFNAIRLPFSNQAVEQNPVVWAHLEANPDLQGLHALDIMDRIVAAAAAVGLRIILDDARSTAGKDAEPDGLWYTSDYPESSWIADWKMLAARYANQPTVVGMDIRNEPHTAPPGPWSVHTYLNQGATWGAYKGIEHADRDWHLAAERGGDAILSVNPHLLIFVEGIQQYPDPTWQNGIESYWWGGILYPARRYPVRLDVPHQLVYAPHEYGPIKWQMPFFGAKMTYSSMAAVWEKHWGFLEKSSFPDEAPIFIGEFGTCGATSACVDDSTPGSQGLWFRFLMEYLKRHPEIGWGFWAINGTNIRDVRQPNYLLDADWHTVRLHKLANTLRDIELPPPPAH